MIPRTMRVARLERSLEIAIAEMDVPSIGPDEILVRTRACGICSGDIMGWYMQRKAPLVFGHEPAGEVAAVGAEGDGVRPGDRGVVHHHAPCFRCPLCARGELLPRAQGRA